MVPFNHRLPSLLALAAAGFLVVSACGSSPGTTGAADSPQPGAAGAEPNTGEGVAVPYTDAQFHYRIDAPGHMTPNADGSAAYIGPSERLEITVIRGAGASDPGGLAAQDLKALASAAPSFHQLSSPAKGTLGANHVTRFAYTWVAGTSAVTGKPIELTSVRYYVSKDSNTLAVVTYGIVSNQFDPQGADDIVSTFLWQ